MAGVLMLAGLWAGVARGQIKELTPHGSPSAAVWAAQGPGVIADIPYTTVEGATLRLDAVVPEGTGPFPMVLLVHGGGWSGGNRLEMDTFFPALRQAGMVAFSIDYRLAPKWVWPACFEDVETAITWVKSHAADYKGDPHRLALVGYSAGGQLVTLAATRAEAATGVQAVVGLAAPTDLTLDLAQRGGLSPSLQKLLNAPKQLTPASREQLHELSAVNFVRPGLPPFLLMHGTADRSVPYACAVEFAGALRTARVPVRLITLPGSTHHFDTWDRADPDYEKQMVNWLKQQLGVRAGGASTQP